MDITENNPNSYINNRTKTNKRTILSITRCSDDKQRQYAESIHQDHHVSFVKLIRNIYQQGLGTFRWTFLRNRTRRSLTYPWPWRHKTLLSEHDFCTQTRKSTNQIAWFHVSSMIFVIRALSKVLCLQGLVHQLSAQTLVTFYKVWVGAASSWISNKLGNVYQ